MLTCGDIFVDNSVIAASINTEPCKQCTLVMKLSHTNPGLLDFYKTISDAYAARVADTTNQFINGLDTNKQQEELAKQSNDYIEAMKKLSDQRAETLFYILELYEVWSGVELPTNNE